MKDILRNKRILFGFFLLLFSLVPSIYFFIQYQSLKNQLTTDKTKEDAFVYVEKAGRHILLPDGETPTIFTVTQKDRLSGQAFFVNAKNGDKVLVYEKAKKAFLYDPEKDKILEVGPVQSSTTSASVSPTPIPSPVRFALYNGTSVVGLTKQFEPLLVKEIPWAIVTDRDNAKELYETSMIIDVSGSKKAEAERYAQALGIKTGVSPSKEAIPEGADFLIILGADKK